MGGGGYAGQYDICIFVRPAVRCSGNRGRNDVAAALIGGKQASRRFLCTEWD